MDGLSSTTFSATNSSLGSSKTDVESSVGPSVGDKVGRDSDVTVGVGDTLGSIVSLISFSTG